MSFQIGLLLALILVGLVLFATEWIEANVTALGLLMALVLTGLLPADQAFAGFGSDTVIMIFGLLILTSALMRTGVMDLVGRRILRRTGDDPVRVQIVVMVASAGLGAFMSNTASIFAEALPDSRGHKLGPDAPRQGAAPRRAPATSRASSRQ